MPMDARQAFVGLVTATSEVVADRGALTIADNVTLRKSGSLTSRYGFDRHKALSRRYEAAIPYQKKWVFLEGNTSVYNDDQVLLPNPTGSGARVRADVISWQEARKNLYLATAGGVLKLSSPDDAALSRTGLPVSDVLISTEDYLQYDHEDDTWLQYGNEAGYRAVAVKTDPNGVELRSRPTSMLTVVNLKYYDEVERTVAPTVFVDIAPADVGKLDKIELYRTRQFPMGQTKDDELQLVATFTRDQILSADPRPYRHVDHVKDEERGLTLYTSPSRGGIESANDRPPGCACLELFRGSLFFGNIAGHQRIVMSYDFMGEGGVEGGVGAFGETAAVSGPGSTTITLAFDYERVQVGQQVMGPAEAAENAGAWPYRVTAKDGAVVTIAPPFGAGTPTDPEAYVRFRDVVQIGTTVLPLADGSETLEQALAKSGAPYTAYTLVDQGAYSPGYDTTVVIESLDPSGAPIPVRANKGSYMNPPVAEFTDPEPSYTEGDAYQNGLAWSEPDEPEHVPIRNRARIADAGKAILGLVATRDSLMILKEDGVYRLTGYHPEFRIDPFDTSAACILPGSIQRLNNVVFALCVSGLVAIGEDTGVVTLSRPIQDQIAPIVLAIRRAKDQSGQYVMPGMSPSASAIDEAHGEYLLGLGTTSPSFGGQMLVYSAAAQGFTTYTLRDDPPVVPPPVPPIPPRVPHALATSASGAPVPLTLAEQLVVAEGPIYAVVRVAPHGFSETALVQKVWSHVVAGVCKLYGATVVSVRFGGAMPQPYPKAALSSIIEALDLPLPPVPPPVPQPPAPPPLIDLYGGSLLRHPVPRVLARSWVLRIELLIELYWGEVELVLLGAESRDGIPNKAVQHAREAS